MSRIHHDTNSPRDQPVKVISDYYSIVPQEDGTVDVVLIPNGRIAILPNGKSEAIDVDTPLVVHGIVPWSGLEDDIRANYYGWCELATQEHRRPRPRRRRRTKGARQHGRKKVRTRGRHAR